MSECKSCHREQVFMRVYGDEFYFCPVCETTDGDQLEFDFNKKDENDEGA